MENIHGGTQHSGKFPRRAPHASQLQYRLIKLRSDLRRDISVATTSLTESPEWLDLKARFLEGLADRPELHAAALDLFEELERGE